MPTFARQITSGTAREWLDHPCTSVELLAEIAVSLERIAAALENPKAER